MSDTIKKNTARILLLIILTILVRPISRMVTFCNPGEGIILGCFTPTYFVLMAGYVLMTLVWATLTLWAFVRLDEKRIEALRSLIGDRPTPFWSGYVLVVLAAGLVRGLDLRGWLVLPSDIADQVHYYPLILLGLLSLLAWLLVDAGVYSAIEADLEARLSGLTDRFRSLGQGGWRVRWASIGASAALGILIVLFLAETVSPRMWQYPLLNDASWHVYLGQHILRGGIPYVTVIYPYSPIQFLLSLLWAAIPRLTGLPLMPFIRGVDLVVGCGVLLTGYAVGKRFTRRTVGGLLAAAFLLVIEHIQHMIITGPTVRLTSVLCLLLGVWLAQRRKWFWAGFFAAMVWLLWPPAIVMPAAIGGAAFFADTESESRVNFRAAISVIAGVIAPVVAIISGLVVIGDLTEAYQQNILALWIYLKDVVFVGRSAGAAAAAHPITEWRLWRKIAKMGDALPGDAEIGWLMVSGVILTPFVVKIRRMIREPERSAPLLATLLMAAVVIYDYKGDARDSIMLMAPLAVFGGAAVTWLLASPGGVQTEEFPRLRNLLGGVSLTIVLLVGSGDSHQQLSGDYALTNGSVSDQIQLAQDLNAVLLPGDEVESIGDAWLLVFMERNKPIPPRWLEYKMRALDAAGWTEDNYYAALHAHQPVIILDSTHVLQDSPPDWLRTEYVDMGQLVDYGAHVLVRADRADVMEVFSRHGVEP